MSADELAALVAAFDLTDSDIEDEAERIAGQVQRMAVLWHTQCTPEAVAIKYLRSKAIRHHVTMPAKAGFTQRLNRMGDAAWVAPRAAQAHPHRRASRHPARRRASTRIAIRIRQGTAPARERPAAPRGVAGLT